MKEKIAQDFNRLFEDAPKTRKALDLKQEMLQNTIDKYEDMVQEGYAQEDAYQNAIASIGDVSELFADLEEKSLLDLSEKDRRKVAMIKSAAIGTYILAGVCFFAVESLMEMYRPELSGMGLIMAGLICIAPTVMLVYAANMYPNCSGKQDASMVEQYKLEKYQNKRNKAIMCAVSSMIWSLTLVVYFFISFRTGAWHLTWLIFLIAVCVQSAAALINILRWESK